MTKAFAMKCNERVEIGLHVVNETSDLSLGQWPLKNSSHVIIGSDVRLYLNGHDVHNKEFSFHQRHPEGLVIEDYAWVCPGVCVLPSVDRIGWGGVINTCSVVYEDVTDMGIYGGNPAQRLRTRRAVHSDLPVESHQNNDL